MCGVLLDEVKRPVMWPESMAPPVNQPRNRDDGETCDVDYTIGSATMQAANKVMGAISPTGSLVDVQDPILYEMVLAAAFGGQDRDSEFAQKIIASILRLGDNDKDGCLDHLELSAVVHFAWVVKYYGPGSLPDELYTPNRPARSSTRRALTSLGDAKRKLLWAVTQTSEAKAAWQKADEAAKAEASKGMLVTQALVCSLLKKY
jgi:hypothetical protein